MNGSVKRPDDARKTRRRAQISLDRAPLSAALLFLTVFLASARAGSSQPAKSDFDFDARSKEVLSHVSAVIRFYQKATTPIQKVGEPNDIVYRDQAVTLSSQTATLAFQSASAEADLMTAYQRHQGIDPASSGPAEAQKLQALREGVEKRLTALKSRETELDQQIASARGTDTAVLQGQRKQLASALDLANAMADALQKIVGAPGSQAATGLASDIDNLQRSVPQLDSKAAPVAAQLAMLDHARSAGVSSQTMVVFELLEAERSLDELIKDSDDLHTHALALRTPITNLLHDLMTRGQQLSDEAMNGAAAPTTTAEAGAEQLESMTKTFKALSSTSIPLSQEIIAIEQSRANLTAWRGAVDREYKTILHALLLRLMVMAIALAVIFAIGQLWTRAVGKYVHDVRRRRQFLVMRRAVLGFLSAIVLLFGFVTQFDSLATFAGFITAGVAVGLQTILLSVAAYFFIIGRYGIKVGDRISITGVTGDVVDVGLVRFYMMELAGNGIELNPTGRIVVFSNSVLFQAASPLYKQIPGTEYAWHELTLKLAETANYQLAASAILAVVQATYERYRSRIEDEHHGVTQWLHTSLAPPAIESRLQFDASGSLQFWARYPVQIKNAATTDEQLTEALLRLLAENKEVKDAVASMPKLQAAVKG